MINITSKHATFYKCLIEMQLNFYNLPLTILVLINSKCHGKTKIDKCLNFNWGDY